MVVGRDHDQIALIGLAFNDKRFVGPGGMAPSAFPAVSSSRTWRVIYVRMLCALTGVAGLGAWPNMPKPCCLHLFLTQNAAPCQFDPPTEITVFPSLPPLALLISLGFHSFWNVWLGEDKLPEAPAAQIAIFTLTKSPGPVIFSARHGTSLYLS